MNNQVTSTNKNNRVSTGFDLKPQSIQEAMQFATMVSGSQLAPKDFRGKPEDTLVAMMMGNELGLNPMQAIQNIAVINGRPTIWGDAMIALAQNHPAFDGIKETFDEPTMTASCQVKRKGGDWHEVTFSQADAEQAKLWGKQGPWMQYPKRMLKLRARGFALRDQFADALAGLISAEEAQDIPVNDNDYSHVNGPVVENAIEYYSQQEFDEKLDQWCGFIESGKKSANELIKTVQSKGKLFTDEQKMKLAECECVEKSE